jgi:hypothetical protein
MCWLHQQSSDVPARLYSSIKADAAVDRLGDVPGEISMPNSRQSVFSNSLNDTFD